jgi:mycothiol synthase
MTKPLNGKFHCRPVQMDDLEAAVELFNAESRWLVGGDQFGVDDIRAEWKSPDITLETDTMAVFTEDQKPVGYVEFWGSSTPHVRLHGFASVHPDYLGQGIGGYLADWLVERGLKNVEKAPEGARVLLDQGVNSKNEAAADLLLKHGFELIRHSYSMRIDLTTPPASVVLPEGITIRSIANDEEERAAIYAVYDSFRDHWGYVEQPFEEFYERWKRYITEDKDYDPQLYFIALDGEEIAGVSLCSPKLHEDPDMGWVGTLGVRRPWRKRGLGLALLQHSFIEFHRRGKLRAGLGVDASSLTGATRLYERAGMQVFRKYNTFRRELRPGIDLTTQNVEG